MVKKLVPTHKYKTTVLFFDDNLEYLEFLRNNLVSNQYKFLFVNNIEEFNAYVQVSEKTREYLPKPFVKLDNELSDDPKHDSFDFDISNINKLRLINEKTDEISTVFIDNNLNNLNYNGYSVCEQNKKYTFNRVLLTGENDRANAINALNSKIIDLYIEKYNLDINISSHSNIIDKIMLSLNALTDSFFINNNSYVNNLLSNRDFKELFESIVEDNNIIEYYLFDKETFLLIKSNNDEIFFKCWQEDSFTEYFEQNFDELDEQKVQKLNMIKEKLGIPTEKGVKPVIKFRNLYYCLYS